MPLPAHRGGMYWELHEANFVRANELAYDLHAGRNRCTDVLFWPGVCAVSGCGAATPVAMSS
eukprot:611245-Prymnesium_polylepis.1